MLCINLSLKCIKRKVFIFTSDFLHWYLILSFNYLFTHQFRHIHFILLFKPFNYILQSDHVLKLGILLSKDSPICILDLSYTVYLLSCY